MFNYTCTKGSHCGKEKLGHLAANSGCAYDSRKPHTEQRKVPTGMHFSAGAGTHVPNQVGLPGAPSTQVLTIENFDPLKSIMNPCTISPLHLGHRVGSALMFQPPRRKGESPIFRHRTTGPTRRTAFFLSVSVSPTETKKVNKSRCN